MTENIRFLKGFSKDEDQNLGLRSDGKSVSERLFVKRVAAPDDQNHWYRSEQDSPN